MADRRYIKRLVVIGELLALEDLHIGGTERSVNSAMGLVQDLAGRAIIPGSTLAGVLRAAMGEADADFWFGPRMRSQRDEGRASRVFVDDASAIDAPDLAILDSQRIDRFTGATAPGAKFDREVVSAGSQFSFRLVAEVPDEPGIDLRLAALKAVLGYAAQGELTVGANTNSGLGRVRLPEAVVQEEDFTSLAGIRAALTGKASTRSLKDWCASATGSQADSLVLRVEIPFQALGALMVRARHAGWLVDDLPRVTTINDKDHFVIPGSSIKGALRSHAEVIVRTLLRCDVDKESAKTDGRAQLDVPLVRELFGLGRRTEDGKHREDAKEPSGHFEAAGCVRVSSSTATAGVARGFWTRAERVERDPPEPSAQTPDKRFLDDLVAQGVRQVETEKAKSQVDLAYHCAVDRWLGNAADKYLYTAIEPRQVAWSPIELRIDLDALARRGGPETAIAREQAALCLLLHVIGDLAGGVIALGYGVNRGYGSVRAEPHEIRFSLSGDVERASPLAKAMHSASLRELYDCAAAIREQSAVDLRSTLGIAFETEAA